VTKVKVTNPSRLWSPEFDLNEKIWLDWNAALLPDGVVASCTDSAGGVVAAQAVTANRPTMSAAAGGVTASGGGTSLVVPNQSSSNPSRFHRAFALLFKFDITNATTEPPMWAMSKDRPTRSRSNGPTARPPAPLA
jgi:hypothetical protein